MIPRAHLKKHQQHHFMNPTGGAFEGLRAEGTGMPGHSFFFFFACCGGDIG